MSVTQILSTQSSTEAIERIAALIADGVPADDVAVLEIVDELAELIGEGLGLA